MVNNGLGVEIPDIYMQIPCLLLMDDVLLFETIPAGKQELLDITDKVAETYYIKFGNEKRQAMTMRKAMINNPSG